MNANAIRSAIMGATKKWTKQRKAEERAASAASRRSRAWVSSDRVTTKGAAYHIMPTAYAKASGSVGLAHARQVFYAARGYIQEQTGQALDDKYFTQTLLPNYIQEHPTETAEWDVVFDARGNLTEPHTGEKVPLGTLNVRKYLAKIADGAKHDLEIGRLDNDFPTVGPENRYGAILFIEKEGFTPLLDRVKLAERYDVTVMSTKGMSVTASRQLIDTVCSQHSVPLLVLHDFDKSGFSIIGTLRRATRRYTFANKVQIIDLGLRLSDIEENNLDAEDVSYGKSDPASNLLRNGATSAEVKFLCSHRHWSGYHGQRVELNQFTSDELIAWIEKKLDDNGVKKIVPAANVLETAYRRAAQIAYINNGIDELAEEAEQFAADVKLPKGLKKSILAHLKEHPTDSWDEAVARQVEELDLEGDK